jgi:hypothetical protein
VVTVTSNSPRVEADETVTLTAAVVDKETPADQMTYQWAAAPVAGVFTGSGRQVIWQAPHGQRTPDLYTITVTVTENLPDASPKQYQIPASVQVHYNDSYKTIREKGERFLTRLFPDYSVSPDRAVQDFSDSCPGKEDERENVEDNRRYYQILSGSYSVESISLSPDRMSGTMIGTCTFQDIRRADNVRETVTGTCTLTAVYENWDWYLCDSTFRGRTTTTSPASIRGSVPGRIISSR